MLARGLQTQMAIDDLAVGSNETRDLEPKPANRATHAIDPSVILPWVPRVFYQPFDRPDLYLRGSYRR